MKKLIALACAFALAVPAFADVPGRDWMPAVQVKARLAKLGYRYITTLEADDGHWEGLAVHRNRIVEFHADARTGRIITEKPAH